MGTLRTPGGLVNPEWLDLAKKLADGDGLNWQGDPDLSLHLGVIEERRRGIRTGNIGHRLEVWKRTKQGEDQMIGSWHPSESWRITYDLCQMDPRSRGYVPVTDRLDKADAEREQAAVEAQSEKMMEALDHAARVHVSKHGPYHKHLGIPGRRDDGPAAAPSINGVR